MYLLIIDVLDEVFSLMVQLEVMFFMTVMLIMNQVTKMA
mgnify:CR=1 FL=1